MTLTEMSLSYAQSAEAIGLRIAELRLAAAAADTDTARQLRLRIEELLPLLRFMAPMVALLGVHQVVNALLAGLGIQRRALYGQLAGSLCSLALAYALTARPQLRLYGYALATMAGHALTLLYNLSLLRGALRGEAPPDREEDAAALTECARPSKA